jgi:acetate kinase
MKVLIFNSGSSSLKFALFEAAREQSLVEGSIDWAHEPTLLVVNWQGRPTDKRELKIRGHAQAIGSILDELGDADEIGAVGHRVVHGGERYSSAVRITADVEKYLVELEELAPLHNAASLEVIRAAQKRLPKIPHFAAFDTAFHSTLSAAARTYPVPRRWTNEWHLRRYGFHGLSHSYCAGRAAVMLGRSDLRLIIAHLGNGASVSAVNRGVSVDISMGFTPLDGVMMGTRSGSVDPGILVYLLRHKGMDADKIDHALNFESGLLGVSGVSSDMRDVMAVSSDNADAHLAVDVYVHRLVQTIGAMAGTLGGVDGLVFTAGVGEHSSEIRRRVCGNLGFLGLELDEAANSDRRPDADVASAKSKGRILIISTHEELTILREIQRLMNSSEGEEA